MFHTFTAVKVIFSVPLTVPCLAASMSDFISFFFSVPLTPNALLLCLHLISLYTLLCNSCPPFLACFLYLHIRSFLPPILMLRLASARLVDSLSTFSHDVYRSTAAGQPLQWSSRSCACTAHHLYLHLFQLPS